jgi:xanthine dehydrogenase YagR molybdenum-binding subunit
MTQVAADALGLPVERVRFELGDTALPKAPVSGGSMTAASVGPAVHEACRALREKIVSVAVADSGRPVSPPGRRGCATRRVARRRGGRRESLGALASRQASRSKPRRGQAGRRGKETGDAVVRGVFAEVRVDPLTGVLRVPRIVSAYSVGRLMNEKTARSQLQAALSGASGRRCSRRATWTSGMGASSMATLPNITCR